MSGCDWVPKEIIAFENHVSVVTQSLSLLFCSGTSQKLMRKLIALHFKVAFLKS